MARNTTGLRRGGPGRPKGVPNKATRAMKEIARGMTVDNKAYMKQLQARLVAGKAHPSVETFILAHAVGKPVEQIDLTTREVPPLLIDTVSTRAEMVAALGVLDSDAGDDADDE